MAEIVCRSCGETNRIDSFAEERKAIERIYRLIAERADRKEVLERFHEVFGSECDLRTPTHEMAVVDRILARSA